MTYSQQLVLKFQNLYASKYGKELSRDCAEAELHQLAELCHIFLERKQ